VLSTILYGWVLVQPNPDAYGRRLAAIACTAEEIRDASVAPASLRPLSGCAGNHSERPAPLAVKSRIPDIKSGTNSSVQNGGENVKTMVKIKCIMEWAHLGVRQIKRILSNYVIISTVLAARPVLNVTAADFSMAPFERQ
jgi:hypothetical protein